MRPVPCPLAGAAGTRADRRQPVEFDREYDDQHHAEPVMRHGYAGDRDGGRDLVDPCIAEIAGDETEEQAERKAQQPGGHREHGGIGDRMHHFGENRSSCCDRRAEIAVQHAPEPQAELHGQRAVEAVGGAQLRRELLRGVRRQHGDERIAGRDMHEHEAHDRHAQNDRHGIDDAAQDVSEHVSPMLGSREIFSRERKRFDQGVIVMVEKSTNQLFGCTKPLIFALRARGPTSCAT